MLTVTNIEKCPRCGGVDIVKNGFTRHGNQRIYCKACEKSPVLHRKKASLSQLKELSRAFSRTIKSRGVSVGYLP